MDIIYGIGPRCGTTSMLRAMKAACKIHCAGEPFSWMGNYDSAKVYTDNTFTKKIRSVEEAFEFLQSNHTKLIKHISFALTTEDNVKLLNMCNKVVFMYRKHYVDVFLSEYMNLTLPQDQRMWHRGFNKYTENNKLYYSQRRPAVKIGEMKKKYQAAQKKWDQHLTPRLPDGWGIRKEVMFIEYDGVYGKNKVDECFHDVVNFFGYTIHDDSWTPFLSPDHKVNSEEKYAQLIPNYDEVMSYRDKLIIQ